MTTTKDHAETLRNIVGCRPDMCEAVRRRLLEVADALDPPPKQDEWPKVMPFRDGWCVEMSPAVAWTFFYTETAARLYAAAPEMKGLLRDALGIATVPEAYKARVRTCLAKQEARTKA